MRPLVCITVVAGLLTFVTVGMAGVATSPGGQIQSAEVVHTPNKTSKSKSKPRGVKIKVTLSLRKADGSKPSPTVRVKISLPKGMILNPREFAKCDPAPLERNGTKGCPSGSRLGTGSIRADGSPVLPNVLGTVTAFNGTKSRLLFYVVPDISSPLTIIGKIGKSSIDFPVPLVPTLPGQPNATLTDFQVTIGGNVKKKKKVKGRRRTVKIPYLANPTKCVDKSFRWVFDFSFENGEQLRPTDAAPCAK